MSYLSDAQAAYARGDLDQAESLAAKAMNESRNPRTLAAFARIVGENGRRPDAAGILAAVVDQFPNSGYLLTLLGEQQVRLGQWGAGTQNIVKGLTVASDSTAAHHTMTVVADLVAANRAGKVPADKAKSFINGILYNTPRVPEELKVFLAGARRALDQGRTVQEAGVRVPDDNQLIPGVSLSAGPTSRPPRSSPPSPPPKSDDDGPRTASRHARAGRTVLPMERYDTPRELQVDGKVARRGSRTVGAGITMTGRVRGESIAALMRRDMELNSQIQNSLGPIGLPTWPSDESVVRLDPIPSMRPALLGFTREDIQAANELRFTEGSINTEIILERCAHSLREASSKGTARPVQLRSADVTKLEVALWDGAIERMRPVPRIFDEDPDYDWGILGIGKFLGDVICKNYGGFWHYPRDPDGAYVIAGDTKIEVLKVARAWYESEDKDDVSLERVVREAVVASEYSEPAEVFIDVVTGLDDRALALKLAEQWIQFRHHPTDVPMVQVAYDIQPAKTDEHVIIFFIDKKWAPPKAQGRDGLGVDSQGRVAIAYDRVTDEFFVLGSRKHFALFLNRADYTLERDDLQSVADLFDSYHCPGIKAVRKSSDDDGPRYEDAPNGADFWLTARGGGRRIRWHIQHREDATLPWKIEFAE